jgi:hypothetical protein
MKRSDSLDMVQQVAARTERERAEKVGAAERHLVEMQQKLAALEKYRAEYEAGFKSRAGAGLDVVGMRDFQTFLARLGEALGQQRELVSMAQRGSRPHDFIGKDRRACQQQRTRRERPGRAGRGGDTLRRHPGAGDGGGHAHGDVGSGSRAHRVAPRGSEFGRSRRWIDRRSGRRS